MVTRVAVVTGANRGIGFDICRQLARRGDIRVVLTSRDQTKGKAAVKKLADEGLQVDCHRLDVTDVRGVAAIVAYLEKEYERADILVNNAGIMIDPKGSRVLTSVIENYRLTLDTNFFGPLRLCQALVPLMRKNGHGRIVNISSGQGQLSDMGAGTPAYRISKAALNALTCVLAAELQGS